MIAAFLKYWQINEFNCFNTIPSSNSLFLNRDLSSNNITSLPERVFLTLEKLEWL